MGWYRTPVELLANKFCCCCQDKFMNGVISCLVFPIILMKSLLSSWSICTLDLLNSSCINLSWFSSWLHLISCLWSVNFNLSGGVCDTGELIWAGSVSLLWFTILDFPLDLFAQICCRVHTDQVHCIEFPLTRQYYSSGNEVTLFSVKWSTDLGIIWCTTCAEIMALTPWQTKWDLISFTKFATEVLVTDLKYCAYSSRSSGR